MFLIPFLTSSKILYNSKTLGAYVLDPTLAHFRLADTGLYEKVWDFF
jgi:hypothetical protein